MAKLIEEMYATLATHYDESYQRPDFLAEDFLTYSKIWAAGDLGRVLDICCGTGASLNYLPISAKNYTGLDLSPDMLARAKIKYPKHTFLREDCRRVPPYILCDTLLCLYTGYISPQIIQTAMQTSQARQAFVHVFTDNRIDTEIKQLDRQANLVASDLSEWRTYFPSLKVIKINAFPKRKISWSLERYLLSVLIEQYLPIKPSHYGWLLLYLP